MVEKWYSTRDFPDLLIKRGWENAPEKDFTLFLALPSQAFAFHKWILGYTQYISSGNILYLILA